MEKTDAIFVSNRGDVRAVRTVIHCSAVLLSIFLLAGCATEPIAKAYHPNSPGADPAGGEAPFAPYAGMTKLLPSTDLDGDGANLTRDGYVLVGTAVYEGQDPITPAQIVAQGEKVKADLILYQRSVGTRRAAVAIADDYATPPAPHASGLPNSGPPGSGSTIVTTTHQGDGAPNRPGTMRTNTVPTVRLPIHSATFWRKRITPSTP